jgi:hypothetical protein
LKAVLPNIDVCGLFNGEGQARRAVFKHRGHDTKGWIVTKDSADDSRGAKVFKDESLFQAKLGFPSVEGIRHFRDVEHQVTEIPMHEIPTIRLQLVVDLSNKATRSVEFEHLFSPNGHSQQAIKSDEVIDVRVRYENMLHPLKLAGRQG